MNDENKKAKKAELTDEQVEKATGGSTLTCPKCKKAIAFSGTRPTTCPYCKESIGSIRPLR